MRCFKAALATLTSSLTFLGCGTQNPDTSLVASSLSACNGHLPDPAATPGKICTPAAPNFAGYRYAEHIAYCNRNVPSTEQDAVAAVYGVAQGTYSSYEFDHYIPLWIGGSDDPTNIWPQPLAEAHEKDGLEQQVFNGMSNGTLTQAQAIAMIRAWRPTGVTCSGADGGTSDG